MYYVIFAPGTHYIGIGPYEDERTDDVFSLKMFAFAKDAHDAAKDMGLKPGHKNRCPDYYVCHRTDEGFTTHNGYVAFKTKDVKFGPIVFFPDMVYCLAWSRENQTYYTTSDPKKATKWVSKEAAANAMKACTELDDPDYSLAWLDYDGNLYNEDGSHFGTYLTDTDEDDLAPVTPEEARNIKDTDMTKIDHTPDASKFPIKLAYHKMFDTTDPFLKAEGFQTFTLVLKADQLFTVPNGRNIRGRYNFTGVRKGVQDTLHTKHKVFPLHHLGVTIGASDCDYDLDGKTIHLTADAGIMNGGNSMAAIREYVEKHADKTPYVHVELLIDTHEKNGRDELRHAALNRNVSYAVKDISKAGYLDEFAELKETLDTDSAALDGKTFTIAKAETDMTTNIVDMTSMTRNVLNPMFLLQCADACNPNRTKVTQCYTSASTLLKKWRNAVNVSTTAKGRAADNDRRFKHDVLGRVAQGYDLAEHTFWWLRVNHGWNSQGIMFPMLSALAIIEDRMNEDPDNEGYHTVDDRHLAMTYAKLSKLVGQLFYSKPNMTVLPDDTDQSQIGRKDAIYLQMMEWAKDVTIPPHDPTGKRTNKDDYEAKAEAIRVKVVNEQKAKMDEIRDSNPILKAKRERQTPVEAHPRIKDVLDGVFLTDTQRKVVGVIREGTTNRFEIAEKVGLSDGSTMRVLNALVEKQYIQPIDGTEKRGADNFEAIIK